MRSTAACSTTFRPDLPPPLVQHYSTIFIVAVLQAATNLEVACLCFRVLRDLLPSIDLPTSPRLLRSSVVQLIYAAVLVAAPSQPKRILVEEAVRPVAPTLWAGGGTPRAPSAPSPPLLAVTRLEVARSLVFNLF